MGELDYPEVKIEKSKLISIKKIIYYIDFVKIIAAILVGMMFSFQLISNGILIPGMELSQEFEHYPENGSLDEYLQYYIDFTRANFEQLENQEFRSEFNFTIEWYEFNASRSLIIDYYVEDNDYEYWASTTLLNISYFSYSELIFRYVGPLSFRSLSSWFGYTQHFSVYDNSDLKHFELYIIENYFGGDVFYFKYDYTGFLQELYFFNDEGYVRVK